MKVQRKLEHHKIVNPKWAFSKTVSLRAMKLGTRMQIPNTNAPVKFQGYSLIICPFTPHMCGIQGH